MATASSTAAVSAIVGVNLIASTSMAAKITASVAAKITASVAAVIPTALWQVNTDVDMLSSEGGLSPYRWASQQKRTDLGVGGGNLC